MPLPSAPSTSASGRFRSAAIQALRGLPVGPDDPNAALLEHVQGAREIGHARHRDEFRGAGRDFAHHPIDRGGAILRDQHGMRPGGIGACAGRRRGCADR